MKVSLPILIAVSFLACGVSFADDKPQAKKPSIAEQLQAAKSKLPQAEHLLQYKFQQGETIRWKVTHLATTETKIQGNTQSARSRSVSIKAWKVSEVTDEGDITFIHTVEKINMWQKLSNRPEERFDSESGEPASSSYEQVAKSVGVPLTTFTIKPSGQLLKRESKQKEFDLGMGQVTIPFPAQPIPVGQSWNVPTEVRVRLDDGRNKAIKIRKRYTLKDVNAGLATIAVNTQVVTPVNDPKIESQLVQKLTKGTVKFDLEKGQLVSQEISWDETVIGFNGPDSSMQYLARFSEELLPGNVATAKKPAEKSGAEKK